MEVILLEKVGRLGSIGDVVTVKNGYAHNYLLPQKKALRKTKDNMAYFEAKKADFEARNQKLKAEAEALAKELEGLSVIVVRQAAETGQLYGSVTARDIHDAIHEAGYKIARSQIVLNQPFKNIGLFDIQLSLHPDVTQTIRLNIARSNEEAKRQEKKHAQTVGQAAAPAEAKSAESASNVDEAKAE